MTNVTPFSFETSTIRVVTGDNGEPLFVGKDLCEALGYKDPTTAIRSHCRGVQKLHPIPDALGRMQDARVLTEADMFRLIVNSTLPAAARFEAWVFEEVLPTIRKTGSYTHQPAATQALPAPKVFTDYFKVARLIGLDRNAAAVSANQTTFKLTGTNVLQLMGLTHVESEKQEILLTPTEIGAHYMGGISARKVNMLLAEAGLQARKGEHWVPLPAAEGFCRVLDTGKRHGDGSMIQQVKWLEGVVKLIPSDLALAA